MREPSNYRSLMHDVMLWKTAAEKDDIPRYFWYHDDVSVLESGERYAVIAHKGEGKSAIAGWLETINTANKSGRCAKITLKDYDLSPLYELSDHNKALSNQYSTLWSYVIICAICRMMKEDPHIDPEQLYYMESRFKKEFSSTAIDINSIVNRGGGFTFLGFGMTLGAHKKRTISQYSKTVSLFISELSNLKLNKPYYIIFDELDEDYHNVVKDDNRFDDYRNLLIGLIRSINFLKKNFKSAGKKLYPVMMLRKDVFEVLQFNDKNKLSDDILDISWTPGRLHSLLSFRISRSIDASVDPANVKHFNDVCPFFLIPPILREMIAAYLDCLITSHIEH